MENFIRLFNLYCNFRTWTVSLKKKREKGPIYLCSLPPPPSPSCARAFIPQGKPARGE